MLPSLSKLFLYSHSPGGMKNQLNQLNRLNRLSQLNQLPLPIQSLQNQLNQLPLPIQSLQNQLNRLSQLNQLPPLRPTRRKKVTTKASISTRKKGF